MEEEKERAVRLIKRLFMACVMLGGVLLSGCQPESQAANTKDGAGAPVQVYRINGVSTACDAGGVLLDVGVDTNLNGELDAGEVTEQVEVCHGETGAVGLSSLIVTLPIDAGSTCSDGGVLIQTGLDVDQNTLLDTAEIISEQNLCFGGQSTRETQPSAMVFATDDSQVLDTSSVWQVSSDLADVTKIWDAPDYGRVGTLGSGYDPINDSFFWYWSVRNINPDSGYRFYYYNPGMSHEVREIFFDVGSNRILGYVVNKQPANSSILEPSKYFAITLTLNGEASNSIQKTFLLDFYGRHARIDRGRRSFDQISYSKPRWSRNGRYLLMHGYDDQTDTYELETYDTGSQLLMSPTSRLSTSDFSTSIAGTSAVMVYKSYDAQWQLWSASMNDLSQENWLSYEGDTIGRFVTSPFSYGPSANKVVYGVTNRSGVCTNCNKVLVANAVVGRSSNVELDLGAFTLSSLVSFGWAGTVAEPKIVVYFRTDSQNIARIYDDDGVLLSQITESFNGIFALIDQVEGSDFQIEAYGFPWLIFQPTGTAANPSPLRFYRVDNTADFVEILAGYNAVPNSKLALNQGRYIRLRARDSLNVWQDYDLDLTNAEIETLANVYSLPPFLTFRQRHSFANQAMLGLSGGPSLGQYSILDYTNNRLLNLDDALADHGHSIYSYSMP